MFLFKPAQPGFGYIGTAFERFCTRGKDHDGHFVLRFQVAESGESRLRRRLKRRMDSLPHVKEEDYGKG